MKVILLAAGRSRRAKPIEDKNFLRFCGKYLIEHQLEALQAAGFNEILLVGGAHNLDKLTTFAEKWEGVQAIEQENLDDGMAGAVMSSRPHIEENEPILIVSSNDVVAPRAYELIYEATKNEAWESALLGKKVASYFPGGYLEVDESGRILSMIEKPGAGNEPSDLVNLVLHLHKSTTQLFETLEAVQTDRDDRYEVALDTLMKNGTHMQAIPYDGFWQPIKFPWHVFDVARYFFEQTPKQISPEATVHEKAHVEGEVIIEAGAKIFAGATVVGPAYIGKNSIVATNALVRDSYLGENCVIGFSTEVARSVLGDDVWTHSNYLGDSLIGDDVSFGAGCITGNLRFDEKNVQVSIGKGKVDSGTPKLGLITGNRIRVGINTSFMPGIKVGSDSLIGAGITLNQDIEPASFVRGETTLKISSNKSKDLPSREDFRNQI